MAQISSYPTIIPQLGDRVLGSNNVDASGAAVIGNPTVQYSLTDIKSVVAKNFVQQLYTASALTITPPVGGTGASIKFGTADVNNTTDNVYYVASTNTVSFVTAGTYYIELQYNTAGAGETSPYFAFATNKSDGTQVGLTTLNKTFRKFTSDRTLVKIDLMVNITSSVGYQFFGSTKAGGEAGTLVVNAIATGWADVPSAALTIKKLA
tara:strand:+ start:62 stop:685 length:624 start_codon:yes stop_codon:yes gene_type:complete